MPKYANLRGANLGPSSTDLCGFRAELGPSLVDHSLNMAELIPRVANLGPISAAVQSWPVSVHLLSNPWRAKHPEPVVTGRLLRIPTTVGTGDIRRCGRGSHPILSQGLRRAACAHSIS